MSRPSLSDFCVVLNQAFAIGAQLGDDESLHLQMPEGLTISVVHLAPQSEWVFHTAVASTRAPGAYALVVAAMTLNLFQADTGTGAIGLDPERQALVHSERLISDDLSEVTGFLDTFCERALRIQRTLADAQASMPAEELQAMEQRVQAELDAVEASSSLAPVDSLGVRTGHGTFMG